MDFFYKLSIFSYPKFLVLQNYVLKTCSSLCNSPSVAFSISLLFLLSLSHVEILEWRHTSLYRTHKRSQTISKVYIA